MNKKITHNNIELELRAEIKIRQFAGLFRRLKRYGKFVRETRRLSVMFLGETVGQRLDIRIRIDTDGYSEVVCKKGDFHSHDRVEHAEPIFKRQILGLVKFFSLFGFQSKVTERENFHFSLADDINHKFQN